MTLKDNAYNYVRKCRMNKYTRMRCEYEINIDNVHNAEILYITVAFNNAVLIKYQHRLLKRFVKNKFSYLVADNSNDNKVADIIREYCSENQIAYIKLPANPLKLSDSHAAALNWVCRNVLARLKNVEWIGFIDHDCFPIKETSVPDARQEFCGLMQNREEKWYLWPGFCFFKTACIDVGQLDFGCTKWGDTGSAMHEKLLKLKKESSAVCFAEQRYEQILINDDAKYAQECQIEVFNDAWYHILNGSNWLGVDNTNKMERVYQLLDKILMEDG